MVGFALAMGAAAFFDAGEKATADSAAPPEMTLMEKAERRNAQIKS